jgi:hypothetical protein
MWSLAFRDTAVRYRMRQLDNKVLPWLAAFALALQVMKFHELYPRQQILFAIGMALAAAAMAFVKFGLKTKDDYPD